MESLDEPPKSWRERLRSMGEAILTNLGQVSPYQVSLDPNYFRDVHGTVEPDVTDESRRPLPGEQA
jgi:hypothetical protein